MLIEEILIIVSNNTLYAIETRYIDQILHVPETTKLLLMPDAVLGISSVSGKIITVLDFNILMHSEAVNRSMNSSRVITMRDGFETSSLVVDSVINTIEVDQSALHREDDVINGVVATYKFEDQIIQVVSPEKLFEPLKLHELEKRKIINGNVNSQSVEEELLVESDRYLLFLMGGESYAISIDNLREIISIRDDYTELPGSSDEIKGLISLRDELVIIVDLRKYYNFEAIDDESNNILIASIGNKNIGLIVDTILDIRDYNKSNIDIMPKNFADEKISGIIHSDEKLISIIGDSVICTIFDKSNHFIDNNDEPIETEERDSEESNILEIIQFKLNKEQYALDIDNIVEIIDATEVTKIADTSQFIKGLINIRGKIIPLISLNIALEIEEEFSENSKIIICSSKGEDFGFLVNEVTDIIEVADSLIHKESSENTLFESVIHLDEGKSLVMLLNIEKIMSYEMGR